MKTTEKTRTKPLRAKDYVSSTGDLNMTRLVDAALAELAGIRINSVGGHGRRSRGVIISSFINILVGCGYADESGAWRYWMDQVKALDDLAASAS